MIRILISFASPNSIKLSEIYLVTTGKEEAAVRARALELIAQIRAGADFGALAAANSEREKNGQRTAPQDKGYVGEFDVPNLREDLVAALKDVKVGGVTEPIRSERWLSDPARRWPVHRADRLRPSMTIVFAKQCLVNVRPRSAKRIVQNLRNEAFIKVTEAYRASVEPLLKITAPVAAKGDDKDDNKKPKKP